MIIECHDLIIGKAKNKSLAKEPYRAEPDIDKIAKEIFLTKSKTAMINLEATNSSNSFYKAEPDLCQYISKEQRDEYFYVLKSGMYSPIVPAKLLFMLTECFKQHGTYNMLLNFIPKRNIEEITAANYLADDSQCILSVIRNGFNPAFVPVSKDSLIVPNEDNFDVYIASTDRILIAPPKLKKELEKIELGDIKENKQGLVYNGRPIAMLGNYIGVYKCEYDYRDLI